MIIGLGTDIVEVQRIRHHFNQVWPAQALHSSLTQRILTSLEQQELSIRLSRNAEQAILYVAGRFAAKEAFSKAIGKGVGQFFSFLDVSVLNDEFGCPALCYSDKMADWMRLKSAKAHVSISHEKNYAVSTVILSTLTFTE